MCWCNIYAATVFLCRQQISQEMRCHAQQILWWPILTYSWLNWRNSWSNKRMLKSKKDCAKYRYAVLWYQWASGKAMLVLNSIYVCQETLLFCNWSQEKGISCWTLSKWVIPLGQLFSCYEFLNGSKVFCSTFIILFFILYHMTWLSGVYPSSCHSFRYISGSGGRLPSLALQHEGMGILHD